MRNVYCICCSFLLFLFGTPCFSDPEMSRLQEWESGQELILISQNSRLEYDWFAQNLVTLAVKELSSFGKVGSLVNLGAWRQADVPERVAVTQESDGFYWLALEGSPQRIRLSPSKNAGKIILGEDFDNNKIADVLLFSPGKKGWIWTIFLNPLTSKPITLKDISFGQINGYPFTFRASPRTEVLAVYIPASGSRSPTIQFRSPFKKRQTRLRLPRLNFRAAAPFVYSATTSPAGNLADFLLFQDANLGTSSYISVTAKGLFHRSFSTENGSVPISIPGLGFNHGSALGFLLPASGVIRTEANEIPLMVPGAVIVSALEARPLEEFKFTPTPVPTVLGGWNLTPTAAPYISPTAPPTAVPTLIITSSATATSAPTVTPATTPTTTNTPEPTVTLVPTATPTSTPSETVTATPTFTASLTPTSTATPTVTHTATYTATHTPTNTPDTAPPSGFQVSIDPTYINGAGVSSVSFSMTGAEIGATVEWTLSRNATSVNNSAPVTNSSFQVTGIDASTLSDGLVTLSVTLRDSFNNVSSAQTDTVVKDTVAPTIGTLTPSATTLAIGATASFTLPFSEAVTITGTPRVPLQVGSATRYANFVSGSVFQYTVQTEDNDSNGIAAGSSLDLNGGSITDTAGNPLALSLAAVNPGNIQVYGYATDCDHLKNVGYTTSGAYKVDPDGKDDVTLGIMNAYCDQVTDGGGWTLILNYVRAEDDSNHWSERGTLPVILSSTLGDDESGNSATYGHVGPWVSEVLGFTEVRFYCTAADPGRVMHFKTALSGAVQMVADGFGTYSGIQSSFTALAGHNANLPGNADVFDDQGQGGMLRLTEKPFGRTGGEYWGLRSNSGDWLCDAPMGTNTDSIHRIWVR